MPAAIRSPRGSSVRGIRIDPLAQQIERVRPECGEEPVLGREDAVDRTGGRPDLDRNAADRQRIDAAFLDCPLGRRQQRSCDLLSVFFGASHP